MKFQKKIHWLLNYLKILIFVLNFSKIVWQLLGDSCEIFRRSSQNYSENFNFGKYFQGSYSKSPLFFYLQ